MNKIIITLGIGFLSLAGILLTPHTAQALSGSDWRAGSIIDDVVFYDNSAMSTADIQAFMNSKVPSCDTNGTKPASEYGRPDLTHAQYASTRGWPGPPYVCLRDYYQVPRNDQNINNLGTNVIPNGAISAAQIIKNASDAHGINPKALLAILQKESPGPLLSDTWPLANQYRNAMGYGCPDTAPCDPTYEGFYNQMMNAAWQFKSYKNNSGSFRYKPFQVNSIYYNPNYSCGASNVTIDNYATAGLYNYTPYQPNQAALNNLYGTGDGCSAYGNRNFWRLFNDWFGSTSAPAYSAQPAHQSAHPTLFPGERTRMTARYVNNGAETWYDDFSAWAAGKPVVKLGTDGPLNRNSAFGSGWRWGASRATDVFSAVYEADGVTLAQNQHVVQPGQIGEFSFDITAPSAAGQYKEAFRPIVEGRSAMPGNGIWWLITVQRPTYTAKPTGQSYFPRIVQGQSAPAHFKYQNLGNVSWYDDFSAWAAGKPVVKLGTDGPLNRNSAFGSGWRWGASRATDVFSAVYEADGVTLAQNQHVVQPGQIGEFSFTFKSTIRTPAGYYGESFRPIVEGVGPMNNVGTWLGVTVIQANYSAKPVGQSYYPTVKQGASAPAHFNFQNTGNIAWYDDRSAWAAGQLPVKLGTNNPLNRNSVFGSGWRWGASRASDVFSAVYEADGVTLAQDQHVVQPGQIGRFDFTFTAPANLAPGYYPEAFLPIVEGYTVMNVSGGPWLGVTVTK